MDCLDLPTDRLGTNETIPHDVFDTMAVFTPKVAAQSQVLGIAVFAYAYVVTIPSWVNEKKAGVNINVTVWAPATVGLLMKIATGILGSWAFASLDPDDDQDIVKTMTRRYQPVLTQYVVSIPEPEPLPSHTTAATPALAAAAILLGGSTFVCISCPPSHQKTTTYSAFFWLPLQVFGIPMGHHNAYPRHSSARSHGSVQPAFGQCLRPVHVFFLG